MAVVHPAVIWLIVAAIVGIVLLIATIVANRNQKKKKKGKSVMILPRYFEGIAPIALSILRYVSLSHSHFHSGLFVKTWEKRTEI